MQSSNVECSNCKKTGTVHWEIEPRGIEFLTCQICGWDYYPRKQWEIQGLPEASDLPSGRLLPKKRQRVGRLV